MSKPHIETLLKPSEYSEAQLAIACAIQHALNRGTLVLVEPPWKQ
jgi:Rad3-related DNA helicase